MRALLERHPTYWGRELGPVRGEAEAGAALIAAGAGELQPAVTHAGGDVAGDVVPFANPCAFFWDGCR